MAFIDLTNVEILEEVSEDAKILVEDNGEIKRAAMPKVESVCDIKQAIICIDDDNNVTINIDYDTLRQSYENKNPIPIFIFLEYDIDDYICKMPETVSLALDNYIRINYPTGYYIVYYSDGTIGNYDAG